MGKTAIVIGVGAGEGLGAAVCRMAASEGLHVFVGGRTEAKVEAVADAIRAAGGSATAVVADTTDESSVAALVETAESQGPIDLAVFNAGNNMPGSPLEMEAEVFRDLLADRLLRRLPVQPRGPAPHGAARHRARCC